MIHIWYRMTRSSLYLFIPKSKQNQPNSSTVLYRIGCCFLLKLSSHQKSQTGKNKQTHTQTHAEAQRASVDPNYPYSRYPFATFLLVSIYRVPALGYLYQVKTSYIVLLLEKHIGWFPWLPKWIHWGLQASVFSCKPQKAQPTLVEPWLPTNLPRRKESSSSFGFYTGGYTPDKCVLNHWKPPKEDHHSDPAKVPARALRRRRIMVVVGTHLTCFFVVAQGLKSKNGRLRVGIYPRSSNPPNC